MNKSQKTLHDLMLKILPFEGFRQNDVVEYDDVEWQVLGNEYNNKVLIVCDVTDDDAFQENAKDLKLISRDWQLPDLLMAMEKKMLDVDISTSLADDKIIKIVYEKAVASMFMAMPRIEKTTIHFDLTKSVLEQESIKEIIKVLK